MPSTEPIARNLTETPRLPPHLQSGGRKLADDPRWLLAQRISISRSIGRSPLLSEFLLYVCERHIRVRSAELTEQWIGVHVFGRSEGYNSNDDNIVRNYARTLRKRVEEYFATEGKHEELKLEIPCGAYIPVFSSRSLEKQPPYEEPRILAASSASVFANVPPRESPALSSSIEGDTHGLLPLPPKAPISSGVGRSLSASYLLLALCVILMAIAAHFYLSHTRHSTSADATQLTTLSDVLWGQLFQKNRDTFIVPADTGLVIMQGLTQKPVSLGDYASGSYRSKAASFTGLSEADVQELGGRRYTSMVDLNIVSHLSQLKEVIPERMLIRYARDLRMDDLRSGNAILLGSVDSNPWGELFEQQLNFRFSYNPKSDTSPIIVNQHPLSGEQPSYVNDHIGSWHNTYGTIAYLSNLDGTGHILLVGGLTMAGTQAAADFLLNPVLMQPVLERAKAPNGAIRPFEILVETGTVASNASSPRVLSERVAPLEPPTHISTR